MPVAIEVGQVWRTALCVVTIVAIDPLPGSKRYHYRSESTDTPAKVADGAMHETDFRAWISIAGAHMDVAS